jgi:hypothetical protein
MRAGLRLKRNERRNCNATSTHRRTFSARPRVGMCRHCARPRARNVRHSGRVRATMCLMSVFLFRIKRPVTRMTSVRCDRDVWTGTFAHECSVNHSWSNLRRVRSAMCGGSIRQWLECSKMGRRTTVHDEERSGRPANCSE